MLSIAELIHDVAAELEFFPREIREPAENILAEGEEEKQHVKENEVPSEVVHLQAEEIKVEVVKEPLPKVDAQQMASQDEEPKASSPAK